MARKPSPLSPDYILYLSLVAAGLKRKQIKEYTGWTDGKIAGIMNRGKLKTKQVAVPPTTSKPKLKAPQAEMLKIVPTSTNHTLKPRPKPRTEHPEDVADQSSACMWREYRCDTPRASPEEVSNCKTVYCVKHFHENRLRLHRGPKMDERQLIAEAVQKLRQKLHITNR